MNKIKDLISDVNAVKTECFYKINTKEINKKERSQKFITLPFEIHEYIYNKTLIAVREAKIVQTFFLMNFPERR